MASVNQSKRSDKKQWIVEVRRGIFFNWEFYCIFLFLRAVANIPKPTLILYMHHSAPFITPFPGVTKKEFHLTKATIIKWQIFFDFPPNYVRCTYNKYTADREEN